RGRNVHENKSALDHAGGKSGEIADAAATEGDESDFSAIESFARGEDFSTEGAKRLQTFQFFARLHGDHVIETAGPPAFASGQDFFNGDKDRSARFGSAIDSRRRR